MLARMRFQNQWEGLMISPLSEDLDRFTNRLLRRQLFAVVLRAKCHREQMVGISGITLNND
jgi:hypothetical protein